MKPYNQIHIINCKFLSKKYCKNVNDEREFDGISYKIIILGWPKGAYAWLLCIE